MIDRPHILASVYELILAWPDNKNAPDDAANGNRGHVGKQSDSSFRSHSSIAKSMGWGQQKRSSYDQ